ncbi:hypothetical protein PG994_008616 [Apiospora phragmitis]|uniref:AAA+ ATPase domain-containing protein n=1 Tax=Apiospora phragmitis TaxID=2905665 RepID=A0ABR1UGZ9_9PEZI
MMSEAGLLVQAANKVRTKQYSQIRPGAPNVTGTPSSTNSPPSSNDPASGEPASGIEVGQQEPATVVTSVRGEKQSAAKAALQDAARKVRELAATTSYDIVGDIQDINKAITELVGGEGWKETLRTSHAPNPTAPQPSKARPGRRNDFEVERSRPCGVQRTLMEEWPLHAFPDEHGGGDDKDRQTVPHSDQLPTIQVFYRSIPSTMENPDSIASEDDFKHAHDISHQREKPQRVLINSTILIKDLESICGLPLPHRPQEQREQLLVYNWPGIQNALKSMQDEQKTVMLKKQDVTIDTPQAKPSDGEPRGIPGKQHESNTKPDKQHTSDAEPVNNNLKDKLLLRINHLKVLVDFIKTDLGHLIGLRMKIRDATLGAITFEELCHLYAPGDLIINRKASVDHLHQVYATTGGRMRLSRNFGGIPDDSPDAGAGTWTDVVIDCIRMRWDGTDIGPFRLTHRVPPFIGERRITDLDFYPVRFRDNPDDLCDDLAARGKKVLECHGHMKYEGLTVDAIGQQPKPESPFSPRYGLPPALTYESVTGISQGGQEIESDVYIDMKTYYQTLDPSLRVYDKLRRSQPSERETPEELAGKGKTACLALLSRAVPAYEFRSREWIWVDITKVEPIDKREETRTRGWKDLVIDDKYRRLLESLVNNHVSPSEQRRTQSQIGDGRHTAQIDLIQGKGRGLIILLHGPPGTGKTSTAEAIAAYTGKPLYAITCGDIGLGADNVEANLLKHTRLAEKWGCVLLLDEADVFLARRGWNDVLRNALVSIFLRHLEYYSGILFLTTNIVGLIDEAFKSRIHVALRYDKIDEDTTEQIWQNLLRHIRRDNQASKLKITFDEGALLDFAMEHYEEHAADQSTWNARQIRNAFTTAIAMGQFDRLERIRQEEASPEEVLASGNKSLTTIKLTRRNFLRIATIADDFEHYIHSVRGDDTETARQNQQRDDSFSQQQTPPKKDYRRAAAYDDEYASSRGPRRGHQSTSHPSRSAFKGKSAAKRRSNRDESDEKDSEVDEGQQDSDVRTRRMRRSRKVASNDEADRFDEE